MSKRKIPDKPCVIFSARYVETPGSCNHCQQSTRIYFEAWIDPHYREDLQQRGINKEYASQLAMAASIRHQSKPDSKPFDTAYLCDVHLLESTRRVLNMATLSSIRPMFDHFAATDNLLYIVFDRNEEDTGTQPKLTVGPYKDIHHFLAIYDQLEQE